MTNSQVMHSCRGIQPNQTRKPHAFQHILPRATLIGCIPQNLSVRWLCGIRWLFVSHSEHMKNLPLPPVVAQNSHGWLVHQSWFYWLFYSCEAGSPAVNLRFGLRRATGATQSLGDFRHCRCPIEIANASWILFCFS